MTSVSESLQISLDNHPLPKKRKKKPGLAKQGSQQGLILAPGDTGPHLGTSVVVTIGGAPGIVWVGAGNAQPSTVPRMVANFHSGEEDPRLNQQARV